MPEDITPTQKVIARFFQDPEWKQVEDMLLAKMESLKEWSEKELEAPAEHVKAELIGRMKSYNALRDFLRDTKMVNREIKDYKNIFR